MRILFVVLFLVSSNFLLAQNDVKLKKFDEKEWKNIVGNKNYNEKPYKPVDPPKFNDKGWWNNFGLDPATMRIIAFTVVIVMFAFILYYVAQNVQLKQRNKKIKQSGILQDATAPFENIEELDIEALLRKALSDGDLRLAVRVHYLLLLRNLNEARRIVWTKDKTNRDYLLELYERVEYFNNVRDLTLAYELVWYGERAVSNESFQKLVGEFESVNNKIIPAVTNG